MLEADFLAWKDETLPMLAELLGGREREPTFVPTFNVHEPDDLSSLDIFLGGPNAAHRKRRLRGPYTASNPYPARVVQSPQLFQSGNRKCLHVEFDVSKSTLTYGTGDHLAVWPENFILEVSRFLRVFGLSEKKDSVFHIQSFDPTVKIPIPSTTTYAAAIQCYLDICSPVSQSTLAALANFIENGALKSELMRLSKDRGAFENEVKSRHLNLAQFLDSLGGSAQWSLVPMSLLLEKIGKLKPRLYSISSSSLQSRKTILITAIIESQRNEAWPHGSRGVATSHLLAQRLNLQSQPIAESGHVEASQSPTHSLTGPRYGVAGATSLVHVRRSKFRLPKKASTPIIMIGPGTDVAPFRASVQERARQSSARIVGKMVLFYGCRNREEDFLHQEEWKVSISSFRCNATK
jgi:NADPH-ferrihemoprotein reductase